MTGTGTHPNHEWMVACVLADAAPYLSASTGVPMTATCGSTLLQAHDWLDVTANRAHSNKPLLNCPRSTWAVQTSFPALEDKDLRARQQARQGSQRACRLTKRLRPHPASSVGYSP